uniref:UBX domain-containing protein 11 n=1 Tax=Labrus bergylta TaxID=56723 RepID=A0A3Q3LJ82_9LABR
MAVLQSFLSDYGLIWVGGEGEQPRNSERGLWQPDTSEARIFHMNFELVLQRIRELNILAGEGECFVQSTSTGAQLAKKDPIQLSLYNNGIVMFQGPFRSYEEQSTQQCMQDLMDGYFPAELQERFPDGVPFEVHDRRHEEFNSRLPWSQFPGEGQAVLGKRDESVNVVSSRLPGQSPKHHTNIAHQKFLNKLPKVIVKAGRVIDVRDSLRTTLQVSSLSQKITPRLQTFSTDRPLSALDDITLKVKTEDGNHTYILKMSSSETIGVHLHGYDIISAYPQSCYDDDSNTLQLCGLTSNATLLLRKRTGPPSPTEVK